MGPIDGDTFFKALKQFRDDPLWSRVFVKLSDEKKQEWLKRLFTIMDPFCLPTLINDDEEDEEEEMGNCIGAIDGTHIHANVPASSQIPYRGRKSDTTQNLMAICSFDMKFTYVVAGKYYLMDSGYTNMRYFLAPYRGKRYHLQEYRGRRIRGPHELFNYRHSSLINVIERCFGILKIRWPILKLMPPYKLSVQALIIIACCTLHNFIRDEPRLDYHFDEYGDENANLQEEEEEVELGGTSQRVNVTHELIQEMSEACDAVTNELWNNYRDRLITSICSL
ncbi:protein ALP1-like [Cornus florida]|uniref:protein ALP1-like n=1 Tax=Cornus florida TaxID=4283 RepID=UPI0028A23E59|nr:protein ALP1-like [Cornus florida]